MILSPGSGLQHLAKRTSMPDSPLTVTPLDEDEGTRFGAVSSGFASGMSAGSSA